MDRREEIIARLFTVVAALPGFVTTDRNRIEFDDTQLPVASVLEGDEEVDDSDVAFTRPSNRPYTVTASPQVYIRTLSNDAGTDVNALRASVIKAVLEDSTLTAMTKNGRGVRYAGQNSTAFVARNVMSAVALTFSITYMLQPHEIESGSA